MEKINIEVAKRILAMGKDNIIKLNNLINESSFIFNNIMKYNINYREFISFIYGDCTEINCEYDISSLGILKKRLYKYFSKKYNEIFIYLNNNQDLLKIIFGYKDNIYNKFITYIIKNIDKYELISKNLENIEKLGITEFELTTKDKFNFEKYICIRKNLEMSKDGIDRYLVIGTYTDGIIYDYEEHKDNQDYHCFRVKEANYMFDYIKGSMFNDKVVLKAINLDFNPSSLPDEKELYDSSYLPTVYTNKDKYINKTKKLKKK